jgi:threonine dehydrogenase-like Zn-dependent dehydrogenase
MTDPHLRREAPSPPPRHDSVVGGATDPLAVGGRGGLEQIAIILTELHVLGSFTYADEFAEVIALLADGALQVADLTSEIARIDDAPAAFEGLREASAMKILIAPNGS